MSNINMKILIELLKGKELSIKGLFVCFLVKFVDQNLLRLFKTKSWFPMTLFNIISRPPSSVIDEVMERAANQFHLHVRYYWMSNAYFTEPNKLRIKTDIFNLLLTNDRIQDLIMKAICEIISHDFPTKWDGLLQILLKTLNTQI